MQHPRAPGRLHTIRDWAYYCERVCGDGWFLVGDAALFVDPILSTGLLITSNAASMAANALHTLWNDPDIDVRMLQASYDATYREAGTSFHRLARIWYSRHFKSSTWHWEAKRQRLRTGRDPFSETSAEAFFQLSIGSFADPIEGAFRAPTLSSEVDRPDARIMGAHLFAPEERAHLPGAVADLEIADLSSAESAEDAVRRASDARWARLLASRLRVRGCTWRREEGYFTDRTMDRWVKVAYVDVRAEGSTDPFDRVVFPSTPDLPEALLPELDGTSPLRDVLACALERIAASEREASSAALRRQVFQLDYRGFLDGVEEGELPIEEPPGTDAPSPDTASAQDEPEGPSIVRWDGELPPPIAAAVAQVAGSWHLEVEVATGTLALRREDDPDATVLLAADDPKQAAFLRTAHTRLWYPGTAILPSTMQLLRALAAGIRASEAADPGAARKLWEEDVPSTARRDAPPRTDRAR